MSFWKRIFRRDQSPPTPPASDEPKLNEDWAPGDQALCLVKFHGWPFKMPIKGEVYIVMDVSCGELQGFGGDGKKQVFGLLLRGLPAFAYWRADCFRKIVPRKDEETTDIGMSELIKQCNPAPVKAG